MSEKDKTIIINRKKYKLKVESYLNAPLVMSISIINAKTREPFDCLTTNLGTNNGNDAIIGKGKSCVNEDRKDLIKIIENNNLGKVDMRFGEPARNLSGFNSYLIYQFNLDVLAEYDKRGVEEYKRRYDENFSKEFEKFQKETFGYSTSDFLNDIEDDEEEVE